jgi:hypothetical protein
MLLQSRDVMEAATAVGGLLASPEQRARVRSKGSSVAQEYRLDRTVAALDNMYGELIAVSGNGRKVVT